MNSTILTKIILLLAIIPQIVGGLFFLKRRSNLITNGTETIAKVIEIQQSNTNNAQYAIVSYKDNNNTITAKSFFPLKFYKLNVGDEVTIFYSNNKPNKFEFRDDKTSILLSTLSFISATILFIVAIVLLFAK